MTADDLDDGHLVLGSRKTAELPVEVAVRACRSVVQQRLRGGAERAGRGPILRPG